ncbi:MULTISPECIES: hypothetical protein [Rhodopseudomonas]|uniref:Membrane protein n=1 Tax=Rhodopseudomonas palustris TaxID=1076 RepID=A0A0D7EN76_RHOPL|nr:MULTISPECIES: hypothetical protein [Rhodopseudomonas]KIZ42228.1 membrane protein [Rhodopseudomonas palustris]MDF3811110.1 hypothetical protein [Rhodopseudomonas sp. BAL398]WOK17425.1 hypothetical protein RBJ75_25450 [Rhodopseudomonas sp. BAL398]
MPCQHDLSYLFGGAVLANAIPHLVSGLLGQPFQTPFAKPRGQGRSSAIVNVVWGFLNLALSYVLLCRVGDFDLHASDQIMAAAAGALAISLMLAWWFGRFNGGNTPSAL